MREKPYLREASIKCRPEECANYPFNIPAIAGMGTLRFHPDVTFFVGENGTGKSTLIEALAICLGFGPEGGTRNSKFSTADTVSALHRHLQLVRGHRAPKDYFFLRAESFYNFATYMDETAYLGAYGNSSIHARSHGEAFMATLTRKLRGGGLYLMDEPEAALSPRRQLAALSAIHQLVESDSQFIIATHSPILLSYPRARIFLFDEVGIRETTYENTEHYAFTKDFLNDYERILHHLMK